MASASNPSRRGPRVSLVLLGLALCIAAAVMAYAPSIEEFRTTLTGTSPEGSGVVPEVSLVVAARDTEYCGYHTACGPGMRTDTIFYLQLRGSEATLVAIPRDLRYTDASYQGKINSVYEASGAEGLRKAVENVLGVSVEHYAILTFESVMKLVNAVDGVDVVLPEPMKYTDRAAGLFIDFPAGPRHLDGKDAVKYMRFRRWEGNDLGRLDRIKGVLNQVAEKAQNPIYWPRLPGVASAVWNNLETTLTLPTALALLPRLQGISIKSATVPTLEEGYDLVLDQPAMTAFTSSLLGYETDPEVMNRLTTPTTLRTLVVDGSQHGRGDAFIAALAQMGMPQPDLLTSEAVGPSTVYVRSGVSVVGRESPAFVLAKDFADLMHLPLQTRFRLEYPDYDVVIVLGP